MSDNAPWEDYAAPMASASTSNAPASSPDADIGPWNDYAPKAAPAGEKQTATGALQAAASGFNAGVADLGGLPVDTARNILELSKAAAGFTWHETTGRYIPDFLQPSETPDVGSSQWIKDKLARIGVSSTAQENTTLNRYIHAAGEGVPAALSGNEGGAVGAARAAAGGVAAGVAQQAGADNGFDPASQAALGILAGHAASRVTAPTLRAPVEAPTATPARPTGGFAAAAEPGAAPKLDIGGTTTAADGLKLGAPLPEIAPHVQEGVSSDAAPDPVQAAREQTLRDVGVPEVRESAITGDTKEAGTDFQTSKLNNDAGNRMSSVIDNERGALQKYASQLTDNSGGSNGLASPELYNRGSVISKPIEELGDYFDGKIKEAYTAADARAKGTPVDMIATDDFMQNQKSEFLGTTEGKQLREGVQARMRDLNLMDGDGNVQSATVQQAEQLKQYLNNQWSPRTSRLIGSLKNVIDEDVTKSAGEDIYKSARQTRALRATLLDDPTGIAKLAPPEDRLAINRAVPLEQVPDYTTGLPFDQFSHVVKTLRSVPPEVQPSAAAALNEIRSHFANRIEAAGNSTQGMWNQKGVNQYLRANQLRMAEVFSPDEMADYKRLNDAGAILRMDRTYPGAAAQTHNLMQRGVLRLAEHAPVLGEMLGHATGIPGVGGVTGIAAKSGAEKFVGKSGRAAVEKRIRKLNQ